MKYFTFLFFAFALLISCKSENTLRDNATTPISPNAPAAATAPAATANVAGGAHYICTLTGCTGPGAGAAGSCSVCGNALAHNQAFHNNDAAATPGQANTSGGLSPLFNTSDGGTQSVPQTIAPAATPEPAQNANGVWHYTCGNGCAGGAGSATACASCGSTLAHNQGYH